MAYKQILVCSTNKDFLSIVQELLGDLDYSLRLVRGVEEIESLEPGYKPDILAIDCQESTANVAEDLVRTCQPRNSNLNVALIYRDVASAQIVEKLQRNSNTICLQHPYESELLLDWLLKVAPVEIPTSKLTMAHLTSIRLEDINSKEKFNFDLYLCMPTNQKFILYQRKNTEMTVERFEKFKAFNVRDLYVRKTEMPQLQSYLSNRLKKVVGDKSKSDSQKRENLKEEAKNIFRTLLGATPGDPKDNRMILESCKSVALNFIQDSMHKPEFYQKLLELTSLGHGTYNHSINVSIYCTLFAMVLGEKNLEGASIGGLLHDIGLATLEKKLDERQIEQLGDKEKAMLRTHPDQGVRLLTERRSINDKEIFSCIAGHHEHQDGSGYPKGLLADQINALARICAIADEFDHLTSVRFNQRTLTPLDAVEKMFTENGQPGHPFRFDQKMLGEIRAAFVSPVPVKISDENVRQLMRQSTYTASDPTPAAFGDLEDPDAAVAAAAVAAAPAPAAAAEIEDTPLAATGSDGVGNRAKS